MPELAFAKGHALGNDYLVLDAAELPWPLSAARVRALCDRHRGVGADGVLLGRFGDGGIGLRIFNPDGGEAEKSGNGLRIFAAWLRGRGRVGRERFTVALPGGEAALRVEDEGDDGVLRVAADMGRPSFRAADVGYRPEEGEVVGAELELEGGAKASVTTVSVGNPHCVVFVDTLERDDFLRRAPALSAHPAFAERCNVQFARVTGPASVDAWVWERGAGETLASGSSACAVAAAAVRTGRVRADEVVVTMPGGELGVEALDDGVLRLRGEARIVYRGRIAAGAVAAWGRL